MSLLQPLLLDDLARVLTQVAGLSLTDALDGQLVAAVDAAAHAGGERARAFAERVLARDPDAIASLIDHVVVNETAFWRHPEQLSALARLAAAKRDPLAIWSAGCSTGEEPYSIAIALLEAGRSGRRDRILATDVSARALLAAHDGMYGLRSLRKLPIPLPSRWFEPAGKKRRVRPELRELVELRRHNLVAEPAPPGPFDAVLCRNVLIYFDPPTAVAVVRRLARALRPGGVLVLGPVELPLAAGIDLEYVKVDGTTLLRRRESDGG